MNKPIDDFKNYVVEDVLGHVEAVTSKRMFGGYGLYQDGAIFGIITSDTDLYFKVDDANRAYYESIGSEPFVYTGHKNKKPVTMPYWHISEALMEDKEKIADLAFESAQISRNA